MEFTFAISSNYKNISGLYEVICSIVSLGIDKYEIVIIGDGPNLYPEIIQIPFNETTPGWITKKKNILAQHAKYENIVLMHDYFIFDIDWYNAYLQFGDDWDICSNTQQYIDGSRYAFDWVIWDHPTIPRYSQIDKDDWSLVNNMYFSGSYIIAKKDVLLDNPFNETLLWGQEEDVEWSLRVRDRYKIVFNKDAIVKHNKVHYSLT